MSHRVDFGNPGARLASSPAAGQVRPASTTEAISLIDARLAYLRELHSRGQVAALVTIRQLETLRADLQLFALAEVA